MEDRPKETISLRAFFGALGTVATLALAVIVALVAMTPSRTAVVNDKPNMATYEPRDAAERELFANLRVATHDEALLLDLHITRDGGVSAPSVAYVATDDITLPPHPLTEAVTIALPPGIRWVGGPLTNQRLVFGTTKYNAPALRVALGAVVYNPMCQPGLVPEVSALACTDDHLKPASNEAMYANLRQLDQSEYADHPALHYVPHYLSYRDVYITTGDIRLAPAQPGPLGTPGTVILVAEGHRVIGGQPSALMVLGDYNVSAIPTPDYPSLIDPVYAERRVGSQDRYCPFMGPAVQLYYPNVC